MRIRRHPACFNLTHPLWIASRVRRHCHPNFPESKQGSRGTQHKCEKNRRESAAIPTLEPPPEMQTNRKMTPYQQYERDLSIACPGIDPEIRDLVGVIDVDARENASAACVDDMDKQQIRNRQAKQDLDRFPCRHV